MSVPKIGVCLLQIPALCGFLVLFSISMKKCLRHFKMKLLEVNDIKWYFSLIYNAHFKCFCPGCSKSVTSFCGLTSFLSPYFVQWFYHIYWNIYQFLRIIRGFYWNTQMAFASYFDTKVTELRFKCLQ